MPYYTGTATSLASLRTAVINACTAQGWTLAGNVLHKNGCYIDLQVGSTNEEDGIPPNGRLIAKIGNGIDGSNLLTDTVTAGVRIGPLRDASGSTYTDWDWPVPYHLHILSGPDEVYLFVNYHAQQYWQQLAWGQSPAAGNAGTGNWMYGTLPWCPSSILVRRVNNADIRPNGGQVHGFNGRYWCPAPFFWDAIKDNSFDVRLSSQIHGAINSSTGLPMWSNDFNPLGVGTEEGRVSAAVTLQPLMTTIPNNWNQETALFPCQILQARPDSKVSLIGELQHMRFTRNTYLDPGAVVALGTDQWKVYPCYRKDATVPGGGGPVSHSGTIAMAIRYDGP